MQKSGLSKIYDLCSENKEQLAIELILLLIDEDLRNDKFYEIDFILQNLDCDKATPALLLAILSLTFSAKDMLDERSNFVMKVKSKLEQLFRLERANSLLERRL